VIRPPFAWVDDELGAADRAWVSARHGADARLHKVDPRVGLTVDDYAALAEWMGAGGRGERR
jgi:hypothetical protein